MPRMKPCLLVAALSAAGAAAQTAAPEPAGDCPAHGVLLDAAALCGASIVSLRPFGSTDPGRAATVRRAGQPAAARRVVTAAPADAARPLAVVAFPDALAAHVAVRQPTAVDVDRR